MGVLVGFFKTILLQSGVSTLSLSLTDAMTPPLGRPPPAMAGIGKIVRLRDVYRAYDGATIRLTGDPLWFLQLLFVFLRLVVESMKMAYCLSGAINYDLALGLAWLLMLYSSLLLLADVLLTYAE
ncbi:hypothetical protein Hdeb2414_s0004g00145111 [Helianthus debilis subsp. tardiflorus]